MCLLPRARARALPLATGLLFALATVTRSGHARADDDGHRLGIAMILGGGVGGIVHPGPLPGPIGFTDFGAEVMGEIRPWGGFARIDYLSSGPDGRWTSFAFAGGVEYRLFGDTRHTALFLRGGPSFEILSGQSATATGCNVIFLIPSSCNDTGAAPPTFDVTADMLGVLAGVRVELPLAWFYLALSANFSPTFAIYRSQTGTLGTNPNQSFVPVQSGADNASTAPSGALELRFDLEAGFRQIKKHEFEADEPVRERRRRRNVYQDGAP